ncbi:ester cyclase [Chitinophagaceae bacterium LB-8]|uniref:Ester cyclase n=1 Tax=Paraflavisolibacter caeni TaxID=2982496 RepID=A0A9X2XS26_9BACT|nr:ester cyclase [Paraflavisolibacter caeni]MCU7547575.1 ester cyclase [Paraflavisolibacter caeni]
MSIENNIQLIKRFVAFINTANEKLAEELISTDAKFYVPGQPEPMHGPGGYLSIIGMMRSGFSDIQWSLEDKVVEENKVAARFIMRGTHNGIFFGVPPTGKTITVQAINFYRFSNGQIVEEYGQPDMLGLLQQIGAIPQV